MQQPEFYPGRITETISLFDNAHLVNQRLRTRYQLHKVLNICRFSFIQPAFFRNFNTLYAL